VVDEDTQDLIAWMATAADGGTAQRQARVPRVIFLR
jgi:hypothetical protein